MNISGEIGAYNGGLQVTGSSATAEVVGEQAVTYPAPKVYTGAELDQAITRTGEYTAIYAQIKGTAVISGNYVNITIDGAEKAQGSLYQGTDAQKAAFTNGAAVTVTGYFITVSGGRYVNFVVTAVDGKAVNKARRHNVKKAPAVEVPTTTDYVLYQYNGSRWVVADGFVTLSPADYRALGQSYNNISAADAKAYLPKFLAVNYPYAKADATKNVMYLVYDSTSKKSVYYCDQYVYNGTEWTLNDGIETETSQFVMNKNKWIFDPTVYITLTYGRNQTFSATYYQACVDWVYENICVPLGDTSIKSGLFYVSKYGNNEYYSGTSAYQNNVDLRPGSAREQYAAGWEGYTDEEIVKTMKDRFFKEVFPVALAKLHPDAKPLDGLDQLYNITFGAYDGTETKYYVAIYKVTAPGTFEPVSCTWYE